MTRTNDDRVALAALGMLAALAWNAGPVAAAPAAVSPDVTTVLGTGPSVNTDDEAVVWDDAAGGVHASPYLMPAGVLPANVDVQGWSHKPGGLTSLVAIDVTSALAGLPVGMPAEPRDVVEYDPSTGLFSFAFDGSAAGVPPGTCVDAVSVNSSGDLLLSFDVTVALPVVGVVDDEDVVKYAGGVFSMEIDGSAAGVPTNQDVDAVHRVLGTAKTALSFDTTGSVAGLPFDDEDGVEYDSGGGTWAMYFDGSVSDPTDWPAADLVSLPEPGAALAWPAVVALLVGLRRRHVSSARG